MPTLTTRIPHNNDLLTVEAEYNYYGATQGSYDEPAYGDLCEVVSVICDGVEIIGELDQEQLRELESQCEN